MKNSPLDPTDHPKTAIEPRWPKHPSALFGGVPPPMRWRCYHCGDLTVRSLTLPIPVNEADKKTVAERAGRARSGTGRGPGRRPRRTGGAAAGGITWSGRRGRRFGGGHVAGAYIRGPIPRASGKIFSQRSIKHPHLPHNRLFLLLPLSLNNSPQTNCCSLDNCYFPPSVTFSMLRESERKRQTVVLTKRLPHTQRWHCLNLSRHRCSRLATR